jgi:hypothetical protein
MGQDLHEEGWERYLQARAQGSTAARRAWIGKPSTLTHLLCSYPVGRLTFPSRNSWGPSKRPG